MKHRLGFVSAAMAAALVLVPMAQARGQARAATLNYIPDFLAHLNLAQKLGLAPSTTPLTMVVALAHPDPAGEQAAYTAMYDPSSPEYHQFLTPAEYAARFGVATKTVDNATAWLRAGGLTINQVSAAGDLIEVTGPVSAASRLFRTPIASFAYKGVNFLANTAAPAIPAGIPVATVVGLNTLQKFAPADTPSTMLQKLAPSASGGGDFEGPLTPQDYWKAYDMPNSDKGQGQSLGIFVDGDSDPVIANLRVFEQRNGLPQIPVKVVHVGPGQFASVGNNDEFNLDTQIATGIAPLAKQLVIYSADNLTDAGILQVFDAWAGDPTGPMQASASFGECETDPLNSILGVPPFDEPTASFGLGLGDDVDLAAEPVLRQATMEGRTLFNSSGDTAALCAGVVLPIIGPGNGLLPGTAPFQSFPSVSPYVVSVGGTVLTTNSTRTARSTEKSWTFGGGGPSAFVSEPAFQKGIKAINASCFVDPTGKTYPSGTVCRGVPDISDDSSGGVPALSGVGQFNAVEDMVNTGVGGTSLSSPLALGMWARIQAAAPKGGLGFADESLYRIAKSPAYHRDFYDVTTSEFGLGNVLYQPGPGYDYTSGLGVMDVAHLMSDLDHRLTPTNPVAAAAVPANPLACGTNVFTSALGNAGDPITGTNDPAVDFTKGGFALSPDHKSLVVTMSGPGLSPGLVLPSYLGGTNFTIYWTWRGKTYFAQTQSAAGVDMGFFDGHVDAATGNVIDHTPSGSFTNGVLQITVPLTDVGNPPIGARLQYPYGVISGFPVGIPGVVGLLPTVIDSGAKNDYQIGRHC